MRAMKSIALFVVAAAALGCSHDKPTAARTTPEAPPPAAKAEVPPAAVAKDTPVTAGLAIAGDLAATCGIKIADRPAATTPQFDTDKDELTAEDRAVLDQLATCLTTGALKGRAVALIGRADPRGTEEYNLALGDRRAHAVSEYLARLGVSELRTSTRGALDATGHDETTWRTDRRVDLVLE